jgi:hypothetical protein
MTSLRYLLCSTGRMVGNSYPKVLREGLPSSAFLANDGVMAPVLAKHTAEPG